MRMQGNYLILKKGNGEVALLVPAGLGFKEALQSFSLKVADVVSAGTFEYNPNLCLGGFALRCTSVDIGQQGGGGLFGRGDRDATILRGAFERRR